MAIDMPDRIAQIASRITPTGSQSAILYTPSNASVLGVNINYQGYMAVIRCAARLDSIQQVFAPMILPTDTLAQKEQKNQMFRASPKKGLLISLRSPTDQNFEIGIIDLYNVAPVFITGVNEFFTDMEVYGIKFGWKIHASLIDRGYGILSQNDWVSITGYVTEKSSFLQDHNNVVYGYT